MKQNDTAKDAASYMASQGRPTMGDEGRKFSAPGTKPLKGTLIKKKNTAAGDPTAMGTQAARTNVPVTAAERNGSSHRIVTNYMQQNAPEAGATLMNAKVIPSKTKRGGFSDGVDSSY
jgi:hypothetical protein